MPNEQEQTPEEPAGGINKTAIFVVLLIGLALLSWLAPESFAKLVDFVIMILY